MAVRKEQLRRLKHIFDKHQARVRALNDPGAKLAAWRILADLRADVMNSIGSTIWTDYKEKRPPTL